MYQGSTLVAGLLIDEAAQRPRSVFPMGEGSTCVPWFILGVAACQAAPFASSAGYAACVSSAGTCAELLVRGDGASGRLPSELGSFTRLTRLDVRDNSLLTGELPSELGALTALRVLLFSASPLNGTIPTELGRLSALEALGGAEAALTGTLAPSLLAGLTALELLDLGANALSGSLPTSIALLTALSDLRLDSNGERAACQCASPISDGENCGVVLNKAPPLARPPPTHPRPNSLRRAHP